MCRSKIWSNETNKCTKNKQTYESWKPRCGLAPLGSGKYLDRRRFFLQLHIFRNWLVFVILFAPGNVCHIGRKKYLNCTVALKCLYTVYWVDSIFFVMFIAPCRAGYFSCYSTVTLQNIHCIDSYFFSISSQYFFLNPAQNHKLVLSRNCCRPLSDTGALSVLIIYMYYK